MECRGKAVEGRGKAVSHGELAMNSSGSGCSPYITSTARQSDRHNCDRLRGLRVAFYGGHEMNRVVWVMAAKDDGCALLLPGRD